MTIFNRKCKESVNYKKVYSVANEYLAVSKSIWNFPFKVSSFVKEQSDIKICSFDKAECKYGINIAIFGSESAIIMEQAGAYIIFYNQDEPAYRVRFSIMHEFGHYIVGHKMNLQRDDPLYWKQELEANCFAAQMLMPEQLLRECKVRCSKKITTDFVKQAFEVSTEAAERRIRTLASTNAEWRSREEKFYDDIILEKYSEKLNQIAPKNFSVYEVDFEYERQLERDSWLAIR